MTPLTVAFAKGKLLDDTLPLFQAIGLYHPDLANPGRKLLFENAQGDRFLVVRATDVPAYVDYGGADLGVAGLDVLMEYPDDLYQPVDLGIGYCRMCVAAPAGHGLDDRPGTRLRVATKYPRTAEEHFLAKGMGVEIIKLYGSMELAPLVGMADCIVDLVSTGQTLRENGLVELETIWESTARVVVNRASMKIKHGRLAPLLEGLREAAAGLKARS
ncbi:MAG: ATP phosphoribosyltransferase [Nitrospirae bacterium]|nr:ATP phosphoribosyltransferase [Nitrospirota bacterium]